MFLKELLQSTLNSQEKKARLEAKEYARQIKL